MIAFIDEHCGAYGVEPICRVLPIAPSTYHEHVARRADPSRLPARAKRDAELRRQVQRVFEEKLCVYGVRKVWHQLRRASVQVARCTVDRLMRVRLAIGASRDLIVQRTLRIEATNLRCMATGSQSRADSLPTTRRSRGAAPAWRSPQRWRKLGRAGRCKWWSMPFIRASTNGMAPPPEWICQVRVHAFCASPASASSNRRDDAATIRHRARVSGAA